MKNVNKLVLVLLGILMLNPAFCQKDALKIFEPFVGHKWTGHYVSSEDSALVHTILWEYCLDSNSVKQTKEVPELGFIMETHFYYDWEKNQVSFLSLLNKEMSSKGKVLINDSRIILEGKTFFKGGSSEFQQTFEINKNQKLYDNFYRKRGDTWVRGHLIEYDMDTLIEFDSDKWNLIDAEVTDYLGRKALRGFALLKDIEFENGIIEYDIATDGSRSYPGIVFRMQSAENYENFYIRPHASNWANALQYTPVINGEAGWQLYNGEGFTALTKIPYEQWIHVKVEIKGTQARVFFNNNEQPALKIHELKHGLSKGSIGIFSSKFENAFYSNFSCQITDDLDFKKPSLPVYPMGIIREWELSQTFLYSEFNHEVYPDNNLLKQTKWQKVISEPSGLVDVCRYSPRSKNGEPNFVLAKTIIHADKDEIREFAFGYSDIINVFINKELVFSGTNSYRSRSAFFQGIVGMNDLIYLPLQKGKNELLFYIAETFGGWGFMCQDAKTIFEHRNLIKEWEISSMLKFPESIVYDEKREVLYVSNYFSGGNEFLSRIELNGEVDELKWVSGLTNPTGLCILDDKLYAISRRGLVVINIDSAKIINTYPIPEALFINDVTADKSGNIYVSDNESNKIFKFSNGKIEVWLEDEDIIKPNGILCDGSQLLVGTSGDGCLKTVNLNDKKIFTLACFGKGSIMDGLQKYGKGKYLISDFNGRIFLVTESGEKTEILNRTAPKKTCADFVFIPRKKLLIIPSLYDNRLTCYKVVDLK